MTLQSIGRSALRATKNYGGGYSHAQIKARNATCNDPWLPSGKDMFDLANMTHEPREFVDIMQVIDKRMNDKGKNWRHVFKSLLVLDYLLHSGSENVILYCEENLYEIKTLREFQYIDDDGQDQGANVRQKAKNITSLMADKSRLFEERRTRSQMHDRLRAQGRTSADTDDGGIDQPPPIRHQPRSSLPNGLDRMADPDDEQLTRAIEESKKSAHLEHLTAEEMDIARAIRLSEEEEERQKRSVGTNGQALFDDHHQLPTPVDQPLIDATLPLQVAATGMEPQFTAVQQQYTSFHPQFTSLQPQFTPLQNQFTGFAQPQFTSYNPYVQQAQQEAMQAESLRQQAQLAQQQALQAQQTAPAQQSAFFHQQQTQQAQPLVPQPTALGSNNPFLPVHPSDAGSHPVERRASEPAHDRPVTFNLAGTYGGHAPTRTTPRPSQSENAMRDDGGKKAREPERTVAFLSPFSTGSEPPRMDAERESHARLESVFANANLAGDGVDTFGNVGQMRFGQTEHGRLVAQKTGAESKNPFLHHSGRPDERTAGGRSTSEVEEVEEEENLISI